MYFESVEIEADTRPFTSHSHHEEIVIPLEHETRKVKGYLDMDALSKDFGLHPIHVALVFGLKTSFQKEIDSMSLETLSSIWRREMDKNERAYYEERIMSHIKARLLVSTGSLEELHEALRELTSTIIMVPSHEELYRFVDSLQVEILSDSARKPKNYKEACQAETNGHDEGRTRLGKLIDSFITDKLEGEEPSMKELLDMFARATSMNLRSRIITVVRAHITDVKSAVSVAGQYRSQKGAERNPFWDDVRKHLDVELSRAKTASEKRSILSQVHWYDVTVPDDTRLGYAQIVYEAYLNEDNLAGAMRIRVETFQKNNGFPSEWERLYAEAYDRLHLPEIESETSVDELRKWIERPSYSGMWNVAEAKIQTILRERIRSADNDLTVLNELLQWPEADDELKEEIRKQKAFNLEHEFFMAETREDFRKFWALLDEVEKEGWRDRFLKAVAHLYMIDGDIVEIEVPV